MTINYIGGLEMNKKYVKPQIIAEELLFHDCITASAGDNNLNEVAAGMAAEDMIEFGFLG